MVRLEFACTCACTRRGGHIAEHGPTRMHGPTCEAHELFAGCQMLTRRRESEHGAESGRRLQVRLLVTVEHLGDRGGAYVRQAWSRRAEGEATDFVRLCTLTC